MIRTNRLRLIAFVGLIFISCGKGPEKQAQEFMELGMFDEAKTFLAEELSKRPKNAELHFLLGKCFLATEELEKAQESFGRATSLKSTISGKIGKTYSDEALSLLKEDEIRKAINYFSAAVNHDSSLKTEIASVLYDNGKAFIQKKEIRKADRLFNTAVKYDSSLKVEIANVLHDSGKTFIQNKDIYNADRLFKLAFEFSLELKPAVADLCIEEAQKTLKEEGDAESLFTLASKYNPDLKSQIASIYFAEAKAKLREQKIRKALKLFNLVLKYDLDKKLDIEKTKADAGVLRAIAGGLSFELLGVWRSESSLILDLMVTNTGKSGKQLSMMSKTRIVDSAGQEYTVSEIILGAPAPPTPGKKSDRTAVYHYPLHSRKQVETWLSFKSVPESVSSITLLEIECSTLPAGALHGFPNRFRAKLSDIPLPSP